MLDEGQLLSLHRLWRENNLHAIVHEAYWKGTSIIAMQNAGALLGDLSSIYRDDQAVADDDMMEEMIHNRVVPVVIRCCEGSVGSEADLGTETKVKLTELAGKLSEDSELPSVLGQACSSILLGSDACIKCLPSAQMVQFNESKSFPGISSINTNL